MITFAIIALGWILIPLVDAVYEGKTGSSFLPDNEDHKISLIMFWPVAIPLVVIALAFGCCIVKYTEFLDKLRKG